MKLMDELNGMLEVLQERAYDIFPSFEEELTDVDGTKYPAETHPENVMKEAAYLAGVYDAILYMIGSPHFPVETEADADSIEEACIELYKESRNYRKLAHEGLE